VKQRTYSILAFVPFVLGAASAASVRAQGSDWTNAGGNAGRNGETAEVGPDAASLLWSGGRPSVIAWQPVTEGNRVFLVRQTGFPPGGEPNGSPVVAMDLDTGAELWAVNVPYNSGDWTTWVAGVDQGKVYASRSGNGASVSAKLYCLDAATGGTLWTSHDLIDAGAYDGVVFAPNGDPIIGSFTSIKRIRASDGTTAWNAARVGSVSGNCGGALHGSAVYVADAVPGGHRIKRFDLATGAFQYQGPVMSGFTLQNSPLVGPDGTIYLSRTQNNASTDFFYALRDDGTSIMTLWSVAAGWSTSSEFAVGPDGSVYMWAPGMEIHRLNPTNGSTLNTSGPVSADFASSPRLGVDAQGRVYYSNGSFATGRVTSFERDLSTRWSVAVPNVNIGAPALGADGTLVIAGVGTDVRAIRTPRPWFTPLCFGDGSAAPCPCGNDGAAGRGCANSQNASSGARLSASGAPQPDGVVLFASGMLPSVLNIFLQGNVVIAPVSFGDGLRCAGGSLKRLASKTAFGGTSQFPEPGDPSISVRSAALGDPIATGTSRIYQTYYRDPNLAFCSAPLGDSWNVTNGIRVDW
jgi:hypothetical protein